MNEQSLEQQRVHLTQQAQERHRQVLDYQAQIRALQQRSQEQQADAQAMLSMIGDGWAPGCHEQVLEATQNTESQGQEWVVGTSGGAECAAGAGAPVPVLESSGASTAVPDSSSVHAESSQAHMVGVSSTGNMVDPQQMDQPMGYAALAQQRAVASHGKPVGAGDSLSGQGAARSAAGLSARCSKAEALRQEARLLDAELLELQSAVAATTASTV